MDKPEKDGDKESIEEILSDLNGLLNRMPAILSDMKMPETRPVDFSRIRREAEERPAPPAEPVREDETIRLGSDEIAGVAASAYVLPDPGFSGEEYNFEFVPETPASAEPVPVPEPVAAPAPEAAKKTEDTFEQSGDFGVPDIDALLQLSVSGEDAIGPVKENKEQGGEMEEKHQDDQERPAEENPGSPPAGDEVPEQPAQEQPSREEPPLEEQPPAFEATVKMDAPFELEPSQEQSSQEEQLAPEQPAGDTMQDGTPGPAPEAQPSGDDLKAFESAFVIPGTDNEQEPESPPAETPAAMSPEPQFQAPEPEPVEQPAEQPLEQPSSEAEPQLNIDEPRLTVGDPQLSVGEPQLSVGAAEQKLEEFSPEPRSDTPFESPMDAVTEAASSGESAEEKTVVFVPGQAPETPGGEETLVYQGEDLASTSRMKAGASLPELAAMEPPATVDDSRIKTLAFMYASGDEKFCADVLATLDAICLKSESRPMFIRRAFVKPCGDDMRGAMVQQMVSEAGASGLICVGSVSQEALYDIENAFGASGAFFRHFSQDGFNLTSALDSVLDLILKP